jgi:hypothetical protein
MIRRPLLPPRHRRLAGAGIAGEAHVQRRRLGREAELAARLIDQQKCRDFADAAFDRDQPDQLAVELFQNFADVRRGVERVEIDRCLRRLRFGRLRCRRMCQ